MMVKMDRLTSNQDKNILHIPPNTFHKRKCFVFAAFVCVSLSVCRHGPYAAAPTWQCIYW